MPHIEPRRAGRQAGRCLQRAGLSFLVHNRLYDSYKRFQFVLAMLKKDGYNVFEKLFR
jgi:hypothetical protein